MTQHQPTQAPDTQRPIPWKALVLLLVTTALGAGGWFFGDKLAPLLGKFQAYIGDMGAWGLLIYTGLYIIWDVLGLPEAMIALLGGAIFEAKPILTVISISIGSTLGGAICFLISRYLARDSFRRWMGKKGILARLERTTTYYGAWSVAIARLTPIIPLTLINYGFGLTNIGFWKFLIVSWICIIPTATFYVLLAIGALRMLRGEELPWIIIGVVVMVMILLFIATLFIKRLMSQTTVINVDDNAHNNNKLQNKPHRR